MARRAQSTRRIISGLVGPPVAQAGDGRGLRSSRPQRVRRDAPLAECERGGQRLAGLGQRALEAVVDLRQRGDDQRTEGREGGATPALGSGERLAQLHLRLVQQVPRMPVGQAHADGRLAKRSRAVQAAQQFERRCRYARALGAFERYGQPQARTQGRCARRGEGLHAEPFILRRVRGVASVRPLCRRTRCGRGGAGARGRPGVVRARRSSTRVGPPRLAWGIRVGALRAGRPRPVPSPPAPTGQYRG